MTTVAQEVIEKFDSLPIEEKEFVHDLIEKMITEARREEIYENAEISRKELKDGKLSFGSAQDVLRALNAD